MKIIDYSLEKTREERIIEKISKVAQSFGLTPKHGFYHIPNGFGGSRDKIGFYKGNSVFTGLTTWGEVFCIFDYGDYGDGYINVEDRNFLEAAKAIAEALGIQYIYLK